MIDIILTVIFGLLLLIVYRVKQVLPRSFQKPKVKGNPLKCPTMVVLGSGGHTTELLKELEGLDLDKFCPRYYVVATKDALSFAKVRDWEEDRDTFDNNYEVLQLPRSRNVNQSFFTSIFTTLYALIGAFRMVWKYKPKLLICNGPGTCVPLILSAFTLKVLCVETPKIVYLESFARVKTLSLSGRIVYYFCDRFFFQWPLPDNIKRKYPRIEYKGLFL